MIADGEEVQLSVSGDDVVVVGPKTLADRPARLFFRSVLGASATADGWRCPRRHASVTSVVLRVNTFLEGQGFRVSRVGQADREVEKELERRRSFSRTRDTASSSGPCVPTKSRA